MITIAISTVEKNFLTLLKRIKNVQLEQGMELLIICQISPESDSFSTTKKKFEEIFLSETCSDFFKLRVYQERGLSLSRNRAIESCSTSYVWFIDDDVEFIASEFSKIIDLLTAEKPDLLLVKIGSLEDKNAFYKDYRFRVVGFNNNKLLLLKASSIETLANMSFLKLHNVRFHRDLGLGALYPCGEENDFLCNMVNRGGRLFYSDIVPVLHTTKMEFRAVVTKEHYLARGYIASQLPFIIHLLLIVRWSFRGNDNFKFTDRFKWLTNGRKIFR
jgi:glycosyltransferase involved in cell wall biosynthesis